MNKFDQLKELQFRRITANHGTSSASINEYGHLTCLIYPEHFGDFAQWLNGMLKPIPEVNDVPTQES